MRTTLDIDDRVLAAARAISRDRGISIGAALSEMARRGLEGSKADVSGAFPRFAPRVNSTITLELVNDHRDE